MSKAKISSYIEYRVPMSEYPFVSMMDIDIDVFDSFRTSKDMAKLLNLDHDFVMKSIREDKEYFNALHDYIFDSLEFPETLSEMWDNPEIEIEIEDLKTHKITMCDRTFDIFMIRLMSDKIIKYFSKYNVMSFNDLPTIHRHNFQIINQNVNNLKIVKDGYNVLGLDEPIHNDFINPQ